MPPKAAGAFTARMNQLFGSNLKVPNVPQISLSSVAGWYPRKIGNAFANGLAGHSAFIKDVPKQFSVEHAKHFALVEALSVMPVFSLTFVHYFSSMLRFRDRQNLIAPLQTETNNKIRALHFWLEHIEKKSPVEAPFWRVGLLLVQITTFPVWLMIAATAPPVFHCAMEECNSTLASKYNCITAKAPPFVAQRSQQCEAALEFHKVHALIKTDVAAMLLCVLLIMWLCY